MKLKECNKWTRKNFLVFIKKIDDSYRKKGWGNKKKIFEEVAKEYNISVNSVMIYYYQFWKHMRAGKPYPVGFEEIPPGG